MKHLQIFASVCAVVCVLGFGQPAAAATWDGGTASFNVDGLDTPDAWVSIPSDFYQSFSLTVTNADGSDGSNSVYVTVDDPNVMSAWTAGGRLFIQALSAGGTNLNLTEYDPSAPSSVLSSVSIQFNVFQAGPSDPVDPTPPDSSPWMY